MGHVWQTTDTQLNREVALRILPDALAADPDRLARVAFGGGSFTLSRPRPVATPRLATGVVLYRRRRSALIPTALRAFEES